MALALGHHKPEKRDGGCRFDTRPVDIARRTRKDTSDAEADNDADVFQERRAKEFRQDDCDEGKEAEADELWGRPGQRAQRKDGGAEFEDAAGREVLAPVSPAAPIQSARVPDEACADQQYHRPCELELKNTNDRSVARTSYHWREDAL